VKVVSVLVAGIAYFVLGGLWFTPRLGRWWDRAVGFDRPAKWRPPAIYYIGPLAGCLAASSATALLMHLIQPTSLLDALSLGLIAGLGYGATITSVNAIAPNMPRPGLYALVTGSYHATGALLCSAILYWLS
jgi:hypothetical protein